MSTGSSADGSASRRLTSLRAGADSVLGPKRTVSSWISYFFFGVTGAIGVAKAGAEGDEPAGALGALVAGIPPVPPGPPVLPLPLPPALAMLVVLAVPAVPAVFGLPPLGDEGSTGVAVAVAVAVALGLKGSFGVPSTRRRWARSPSLATATIGSVARVESSDFTAAVAGAGDAAGSLPSSMGTATAAATSRRATG